LGESALGRGAAAVVQIAENLTYTPPVIEV